MTLTQARELALTINRGLCLGQEVSFKLYWVSADYYWLCDYLGNSYQIFSLQHQNIEQKIERAREIAQNLNILPQNIGCP